MNLIPFHQNVFAKTTLLWVLPLAVSLAGTTIELPPPPTNFLDEFPLSYHLIPPFDPASSFTDPENAVVVARQKGFEPVKLSDTELDYLKALPPPLSNQPPFLNANSLNIPPFDKEGAAAANSYILERAIREDFAFYNLKKDQPNHCLECFDDVFPKGNEWLHHDNPDIQTVTDLIDAVYGQCVSPEVGAAKTYWHRHRPISSGDTRIRYLDQAMIDKYTKGDYDVYTDYASFPSGHSTTGMVFALVLADMSPPEYRQRLLARGIAFGDDRVLLGVHYPSDVEAGRVLAEGIYNRLATGTSYRKAVLQAKIEFSTALKKVLTQP